MPRALHPTTKTSPSSSSHASDSPADPAAERSRSARTGWGYERRRCRLAEATTSVPYSTVFGQHLENCWALRRTARIWDTSRSRTSVQSAFDSTSTSTLVVGDPVRHHPVVWRGGNGTFERLFASFRMGSWRGVEVGSSIIRGHDTRPIGTTKRARRCLWPPGIASSSRARADLASSVSRCSRRGLRSKNAMGCTCSAMTVRATSGAISSSQPSNRARSARKAHGDDCSR
jgi:hypothetical protein